MNLNIVVSFIIGGLLLMAVITLNARVVQNSGETVLDMSAKQKIETIKDIMQRDFVRLGYNIRNSGCSKAVKSISAEKIVFCADVDTIASTEAKEITWQVKPSVAFTGTDNPNDYVLIRRGPLSTSSSGTSRFPVTDFSFTYLGEDGKPVNKEDEVRTIVVSIETQSAAAFENNDYSISFLNKAFAPPNLNLGSIE